MLLLVDKPKGLTSHDVVNRIRKITGEKRVGHAGTLDPNATGLLIVGVGRPSTKKLGEIAKNTTKEYEAEIFLGEERDTDDPEGRVIKINKHKIPSIEEVDQAIEEIKDTKEQVPPIYSAIKLQGKKAYDLARKGKEVTLEPRKIEIYEAEKLAYEYPILEVRFLVSSGTYIRSLARDIGKSLTTYGYLKNLRRTKIGEYDITAAKLLPDIQAEYALQ